MTASGRNRGALSGLAMLVLAAGCGAARPTTAMPEPIEGVTRATETAEATEGVSRTGETPEAVSRSSSPASGDAPAATGDEAPSPDGPLAREAFLPADRVVTQEMTADLDDDGIEDRVLILDLPEDRKQRGELLPRTLLILRGVGEGRYVVWARGDAAILCSICGGGMGEPLVGIEAKRGEVMVRYFGGTRYRWVVFHTFRYSERAKAWVLSHVKSLHFDSTLPEQDPVTTEIDDTTLGVIRVEELDAAERIGAE